MSDSEEEVPDKQLKIVIMGDGASGKVLFSVLLKRLFEKKAEALATSPESDPLTRCPGVWNIYC